MAFDVVSAAPPDQNVPPAQFPFWVAIQAAVDIGLPTASELRVRTETALDVDCLRGSLGREGRRITADTWRSRDWPPVIKCRDLGRQLSEAVRLMWRVDPSGIDIERSLEPSARDVVRCLIDSGNLTGQGGVPPLRRWVESRLFAEVRRRNGR